MPGNQGSAPPPRYVAGEIDIQRLAVSNVVDDELIRNVWTISDVALSETQRISLQAVFRRGEEVVYLLKESSGLGWNGALKEVVAQAFPQRRLTATEIRSAKDAQICTAGSFCGLREDAGCGAPSCGNFYSGTFSWVARSAVGNRPPVSTLFVVGESGFALAEDPASSKPIWTPLFSFPVDGGAFPQVLKNSSLRMQSTLGPGTSPWSVKATNVTVDLNSNTGRVLFQPLLSGGAPAATFAQSVDLVGGLSYRLSFDLQYDVSAGSIGVIGFRDGPNRYFASIRTQDKRPSFDFRLPPICPSSPWEIYLEYSGNFASGGSLEIRGASLSESPLGDLSALEGPDRKRWSVTQSGRVVFE